MPDQAQLDLEKILADVKADHDAGEDKGTPSASSTSASGAMRSPFSSNPNHQAKDFGLAPAQFHQAYGPGGNFAEQRANDISRSHMFARPGDWPCPNCGENQYARNPFCRRCKTPRPASAGPAPRFEPGDWICPICGDFQYKRNRDCRKCGTPKSACDNQIEAAAAAARISTRDWTCFGCGAPQAPTNAQCKNCNTRRPAMYTIVLEHQEAVAQLTGAEPLAMQMAREMGVPPPDRAIQKPVAAKAPGDWDCPKCGNTNFAQSFICRCGYQKPTVATPASASSEKPKPVVFVPAKRAAESKEEPAKVAAKEKEAAAAPKDDADSFLYKLPGMKKRRKPPAKAKPADGEDEKPRQEETPEEKLRKEKERSEAEALQAKILAESEKAASEKPPPKPESIPKKVEEPKIEKTIVPVSAFTSVDERDAEDAKSGKAKTDADRKAVLRDFWSFYVPSLKPEQAPKEQKKEPVSFLAQWQAEADGKKAPPVAPPSPPTPEWDEEPPEEEEPEPPPAAVPKSKGRPGMTFV